MVVLAADIPPVLLGPAAALALALLVLGLFYTGKILPRNAVPREDYEKLRDINESYAEGLKATTEGLRTTTDLLRTSSTTLSELVNAVRYLQNERGKRDG